MPLAEEAPPALEPLDPEVVGNLRLPERGGSEALWRRCVTTFLEYCPDRLTELDAAVRDGAAPEVKAICHSLKSSSGMLGARTLSALFLAAEKDALAGRADRLAESVTNIRAEYDRVVAALAEVAVHAS
jgi:HPt (histidine-containing phosphotransfer) domain-containing protein